MGTMKEQIRELLEQGMSLAAVRRITGATDTYVRAVNDERLSGTRKTMPYKCPTCYHIVEYQPCVICRARSYRRSNTTRDESC